MRYLKYEECDFRDEERVLFTLLDAICWIAFGYAEHPPDERACSASDQAERELLRALQLGELAAFGKKYGEREPREVPGAFWRYAALRPLPSAAELNSEPHLPPLWQEICLYRQDVIENWPSPLATAACAENDEKAKPFYRSGLPHRPTSKHLFAAELERRLQKGEANMSSLRAESQELADWLVRAHPEAPSATARTIENAIRGRYNAAKQEIAQN